MSSTGAVTEERIPTLREASRVWSKIGVLSFGGPAAQIALMHRIVVTEKNWLSETQYLNALSFCMLLPGPEAMQLATYAGWRLHGVRGGLVAGLLFVLPGALVVMLLATVYAIVGQVSLVSSLFLGIKAAVIIVVIEALLRVSRKALKTSLHYMIAAVAFIAIFFFNLSFPLIVLVAALVGYCLPSVTTGRKDLIPGSSQRAKPNDDARNKLKNEPTSTSPPYSATPYSDTTNATIAADNRINRRPVKRLLWDTLLTIAIWGMLWLLPFALLWVFNADEILLQLGSFFSRLAVVTFGGAYAVLAYLAQDVVTQFGWLTAGEMMDGLGLAETTPGPLILVTEFVGFLAGYREGGFALGLAAAAVTLWVTFVPCFLWIFAGAPYIEWLSSHPRLGSALSTITAAVVGVILNLSLWFALHVWFGEVTPVQHGIAVLWTPTLATIDWQAALLTVFCGFALLKLHWNIVQVLICSSAAGLVMAFLL